MISRFFKKKTKAEKPKKVERSKQEAPREVPSKPKKLLTAEGWKRMMMRKTGKR